MPYNMSKKPSSGGGYKAMVIKSLMGKKQAYAQKPKKNVIVKSPKKKIGY